MARPQLLEGGLLGKWGWGVTFFRGSGGYNFYIKNKLKSQIFNDKKKVYRQKYITKNSRWEILTKNLVTFKR